MAPASLGPEEQPPEPGRLTALPEPVRWAILTLLSLAFAGLLTVVHIPAALLLGPMMAAIVVATNGARLSAPTLPYLAAHSLIGCIIARSIDAEIVTTFAADWPIFLSIVLAVIASSTLIGYVMARNAVLPGTTAVWGTSAGAASAMLVLAEAYGADARLVAFMQYLRVVCVASAASIIAAAVFHATGGQAPEVVWFPPVDWLELGKTLAVAFGACAIGARFRIPAGTMFLPMLATALLHGLGFITIELPPWLLAFAYALLGWKIGLGFTRRILRHAAYALPQIMLSIVVLIAFCGGLAMLLWRFLGIDPLTAYLATSPGGLDSVAIIAASTPVDLPFVMALQTARFLLVLLLGGPISKAVARLIDR
ncbi:AbrB family transcriptional regulator [Rhizobium cremeum]|uniref:AbrB family transcriptional regulator n=1 Tax=Rhizobium cremeum TaxID=2813827 RepID=UPI000DE42513